jgi:ATP-dependent DNA helicase RecQ
MEEGFFNELIKNVTSFVSDKFNHSAEKGIVYCPSLYVMYQISDNVKRLGLEYARLSGEMDVGLQLENLTAFRTHTDLMIATSSVTAGIDIPNVKWAVIIGYTYSLIEMVQLFGRVGRDGTPGQCFLFTSIPVLNSLLQRPEEEETFVRGVGKEKVNELCITSKCIRQFIGERVEGVGFTCVMHGEGTALCSRCELSTQSGNRV